LITELARLIGAPARVHEVGPEAIAAAGLELRAVSPFSSRWMSCLDPGLAKAELGFRHEPLTEYLGRIVASFLAHPPATPPPQYARRPDELALASKA
jgi:nucleoside-diphosphate-sugar epimerase